MKSGTTSKFRGISFRARATGTSSDIKLHTDKPYQASLMHRAVRWIGPSRATEREAAIDYDRRVLELGLDLPLNILKRKP